MQNIKRKTFWLLAIVGLLFTITACSKSSGSEEEMKISFANNSYEYVVGETFTLNPSIQNGTAEDSELVWSVFDESVVKLVNGEFVALKEGKTIIKVASATKSDVNAMVSIKVVEKKYFPVVSFNEIKGTMQVDEQQVILPTVEGYDFNAVVTYRSLDSNVASVSEQGTIVAFNAGATVIIVRIEEVGNEDNYEEYPFLIKVIEPEYLIEYELNGGKNHLENLDYYTKRQCPVTLKDATREGYTFLGWYDKDDNPVSEISKYEESNIKLFAKWEPTKYNVYFANVEFEINNAYNDGYDALFEDYFEDVQSWWGFIGINETSTDNLYVINEVGFRNPNEFYAGPRNSDKYITIHGDFRTVNDEKRDDYYRIRSIIEDVNSIGKYVSLEVVDSEVTIATVYEKIETYTIENYFAPFVTPVRSGHDFLGWYLVDENGVESAEPVNLIERGSTGDYEFVAKWDPTQYTVKYNLNGGDGVLKDHYKYVYSDDNNEKAYQLQVPTRDGYNFLGWYENADFTGNVVTQIEKGSMGDKEYFAKWEIINYTISYELNGGTTLGENPTSYNVETPTFSLYDCKKEHYNFIGWEDQDGNLYTEIKQGTTGNIQLTAKYEAVKYEIVYNLNGGEGETKGEYPYSETETYLVDLEATKEHYEFVGWYDNVELTGTAVTEIPALTYGTVTLYAKYNPVEYQISYVSAGSLEPASNKLESTTNSTNFWGNYTKHIFLISQSNFTGSINAQWSDRFGIKYNPESATYYIATIAYDGEKSFNYSDVDYILMVSDQHENYKSTNTFTKAVSIGDYVRFIGDPTTGVTTVETYAPYITKYTIEDTKTLPVPTKDGYSFAGWYDNEEFNGEKIDTIETGNFGNKVLYGKWNLETYQITYNLNGGTMPKAYENRAEVVNELLSDYNTARNKTHTTSTIAELGKWSEISDASLFLYNSTYRAKWAWLVDYIASVAGSANKKAWQNFNNYDNQSGLDAANSNYIYSIAYELRAFIGGVKYSKNSNFVTADYSADSIGNGFWGYIPPKTYTVLTNDITLKEPTMEGMAFAGWFDNVEFAGSPIKVIEKGTFGDLSLYAKWVNPNISIGDTKYGTIAEAIKNANDGDVITLKAGIYAENITIDKANISIVGTNENIDPNKQTRNEEAIIKGNIDVAANGFTLNGVKMSGTSTINVTSKVKGLNIMYVYSDSTGMSNQVDEDHNRKSVIFSYDNCSITNFNMSYCYFNIGSSVSLKEAVMLYGTVINANINNNYFTHSYKGETTCEALYLAQVAGTINIADNEFIFPTSNFVILIGEWYNDANISIDNNIISGIDSYRTAGICVRSTLAERTVNIVHNYIYNMSGNTMNFKNSKSGSIYNIQYNYFDKATSYKITTLGAGTINYLNNYYEATQTTTTSDYGVIESLEELETAYKNQ